MDSVLLVEEIEKAFGINIPDRVAEKIDTVQDMYDVVIELVIQKGNPESLTPQHMEVRIDTIIHDSMGISPLDIKPWKSFTRDLGID